MRMTERPSPGADGATSNIGNRLGCGDGGGACGKAGNASGVFRFSIRPDSIEVKLAVVA